VTRYGWLPDTPDQRDHAYAAPVAMLAALPPAADLRAAGLQVYDQGQLSTSTANAIAVALDFDRNKQRQVLLSPSRLFIYYNARDLQGTLLSDSGAQIRNALKAVAKGGVCSETEWPYDATKWKTKPPNHAYDGANLDRGISYQRLPQTLMQMKACLASGYPFVFGFTVYESFEGRRVAATGDVPVPGPGERAIAGHCALAVGYDDRTQQIIALNSWGAHWGLRGYFALPYLYIVQTSLAADFWTIRALGG
jgi:C1A family cysteine protease